MGARLKSRRQQKPMINGVRHDEPVASFELPMFKRGGPVNSLDEREFKP